MKQSFVGFLSTPKIDKAIERERKRLGKKESSSRVNKSAAVRSLLTKASTTTEKPKP